jgi:hypothetical protein
MLVRRSEEGEIVRWVVGVVVREFDEEEESGGGG